MFDNKYHLLKNVLRFYSSFGYFWGNISRGGAAKELSNITTKSQ